MNETRQPTANPVCQECVQASEAVRTMYVHLCSGEVKEITGVTEIHVTQSQVVLQRGEAAPVVFRRRDVYFACCDANEQPFLG